MRKLWAAGVAAGVAAVLACGPAARSDDKDPAKAAEKLVGTYTIVKGEKYGGKPPGEDVTDTVVKITADRITSYDKGDKEVYVQTYKLDPSGKPCKITMKSIKPKMDVEVTGLIEADGDTVKLIYALPGGKAPDDFKTEDKQLMFVLKKKK
jgi:uncharacterized protein (TIGR03067 family)